MRKKWKMTIKDTNKICTLPVYTQLVSIRKTKLYMYHSCRKLTKLTSNFLREQPFYSTKEKEDFCGKIIFAVLYNCSIKKVLRSFAI